jgi:biopolymer transport protein ExbD
VKTTTRGASAHGYHVGPNMTPLVDVVMVLLIFLMLAGSFGAKEVLLPIRTPDEPADVHPARAIVDPGRQLDVFVGGGSGEFTARLGVDPNPIRDPAALRAELERRHAEYAAAGTAPETVQVLIHPTAGTAWAPVVAAHEAALGANFPRTGFGLAR